MAFSFPTITQTESRYFDLPQCFLLQEQISLIFVSFMKTFFLLSSVRFLKSLFTMSAARREVKRSRFVFTELRK